MNKKLLISLAALVLIIGIGYKFLGNGSGLKGTFNLIELANTITVDTSEPSLPASDKKFVQFSKGEKVLGKGSSDDNQNQWYPGKITAIDTGKTPTEYTVKYDDGDINDHLKVEEIAHFDKYPTYSSLAPNDFVIMKAGSKKEYYSAYVKAIDGKNKKITIKKIDGTSSNENEPVSAKNVVWLPGSGSTKYNPNPTGLTVGAKVYGNWESDKNQWSSAKITAVNYDGTYSIKYDDDESIHQLAKLKVAPDAHPVSTNNIQVNAQLMAKSPNSGKFYSITVKKVNDNTIDVTTNDDNTPYNALQLSNIYIPGGNIQTVTVLDANDHGVIADILKKGMHWEYIKNSSSQDPYTGAVTYSYKLYLDETAKAALKDKTDVTLFFKTKYANTWRRPDDLLKENVVLSTDNTTYKLFAKEDKDKLSIKIGNGKVLANMDNTDNKIYGVKNEDDGSMTFKVAIPFPGIPALVDVATWGQWGDTDIDVEVSDAIGVIPITGDFNPASGGVQNFHHVKIARPEIKVAGMDNGCGAGNVDVKFQNFGGDMPINYYSDMFVYEPEKGAHTHATLSEGTNGPDLDWDGGGEDEPNSSPVRLAGKSHWACMDQPDNGTYPKVVIFYKPGAYKMIHDDKLGDTVSGNTPIVIDSYNPY